MKSKNIVINSAALFVIATILQMTLHEIGHFVTAIVVNAKNIVLFHNYVEYDSMLSPLKSKLMIAAAGPLLSLLIGLSFHFVCTKYKQRNHLFLFFLYMSVFGYINFLGYLMISPIFVEGDTGYIFHELGFPIWVAFFIALIGMVSVFYILKRLGKFFAEIGTDEILEDPALRRQFSDALIKYPMFIGIVATTLLNLPVPVFLSLLYPIFSPFALMFCYGNVLRKKYAIEIANTNFAQFDKVQIQLIIGLALVVILNRLLVFGYAFN